jgi:NitT/TauT family transport system substrate-binding protein
MPDRVPTFLKNAFSRLAVALAAISALLAVSPAAPAAAEQTTLRVSALPYLTFAPLYLAQAEGYFEAEGLKVEFVRLQRNTEYLVALLRGDVDVDTIFTAGMMNAMARGEHIRVVASRGVLSAGGCVTNGFVARPDLAAKLDAMSAQELKGLTFGVDPTWLDSFFLQQWLGERGLTLDDVGTKYLPAMPARIEALRQGGLDAVFMGEPWITRTVGDGTGVVWKSAGDMAPGFPLSVVIFGPAMLAREDDAGVRFLRAYLRGVERYAEGKTDRNIEILSRVTKMEPDLLRRLCWTDIPRDGKLDPARLAAYSAWAAQRALTSRPLEPGEIWEPRYLDEAGRR